MDGDLKVHKIAESKTEKNGLGESPFRSTGMKAVVREVFSERNILVLSGTSVLYQIFRSIWQLWWSLYLLEELNAPIAIVGILSTLQSVSQIVFQLPGGVMADRIGRKKVILFGSILRVVGPFAMFLSPTWEWVIPGMILNAMSALYMPAFNAIIADSLPSNKRGSAYGAYRSITSIPQIVMPVISGFYLDLMGVGAGVKLGLLLYSISAVVAIILRFFLLTETLESDKTVKIKSKKQTSNFSNIRAIMGLFRGNLLTMLIVACISGFAMRLVYPFLAVYGIEIAGFTKTQWGMLQTIAIGLSTPLYIFGGVLSDRFGRVIPILVARSLLPVEAISLLITRDFRVLVIIFILLGIAGGLGGGSIRSGGGMGGPSWQALIADLTSIKDRGKIMGTMATLTGLLNLPAPIVGAYLWQIQGSNFLMATGGIIGLMVTPLILYFLHEPQRTKTTEKPKLTKEN